MSHARWTPSALPFGALLCAAALLAACPTEPCPAGQTRCKGLCVDTLTDAAHCGGCDQPCGLGTCSAGLCACDVGAGATDCAPSWPRCVDMASDEAHCGACGTSCVASTGATCTASACTCPATGATLKCGTTVTSCCEGASCCGDACLTKHSNGVGQYFLDCNPLGTHTYAAAVEAADAWNATATSYDQYQLGCIGCLGRQTGSACVVWCYSGSPVSGRVRLNDIGGNACICPSTMDATWN